MGKRNPKGAPELDQFAFLIGDWKETVAEWKDPEMIVTILDAEDKSGKFLNRETYHDIKADSFKMKSKRSYDEGKTWVKGAYFMEVVRSK